VNDRPDQVDGFGNPVSSQGVTLPRPLQLARWVWIASTLVGVARSMVQLADRELLVTELRRQAPQLPQDQVDAAVNSGVLFTLLFSMVIFVIYVMVANRMVRGRRWARLVMTLLCAVSVVGTGFTLLGVASMGMARTTQLTGVQVDAWDLLFSLVILVLDISVLVLLNHPESRRFFRSVPPGPAARPTTGAD
jgi:hypothetical protein